MEGDIDNDIYRNNPCHKKLIEERKVDDDKDKRQCNDTYQSLMLCQSCTHQLMMNMVFVSSEKRFAVKNSNDDNSEHIEGWYEE